MEGFHFQADDLWSGLKNVVNHVTVSVIKDRAGSTLQDNS